MDTITSRLQNRLQELSSRGTRITSDLRQEDGALPSDWEEQATALENSEVLEALDEQTRQEIQHVQAALERIAQGTYGICVRCGNHIPTRRLEALPYSTRCISCAT